MIIVGFKLVQKASKMVKDFKDGGNFVFGRELIAGCEMFSELEGLIQKHRNQPL